LITNFLLLYQSNLIVLTGVIAVGAGLILYLAFDMKQKVLSTGESQIPTMPLPVDSNQVSGIKEAVKNETK
jgi:hypothetical protein